MTRVLVDSSAWIHFFNRSSESHHRAVAEFLREDRVVTCGIVLTEVLRGGRSDRERKLLLEHFRLLEYAPQSREDCEDAAALGFRLSRKGFSAKTTDLWIAQLALKHRLAIFHDDKDFEMMKNHLPLKTISDF